MRRNLLKSTSAYKILAKDKSRDSFNHAYLIVCRDGGFLRNYLKDLAKLIMCKDKEYCDDCRLCRLIESEKHSDVTFYPEQGKKIVVADIDDLVDKSYIKPMEESKRLFVLEDMSQANTQSQNKLLKTLEEPPQGVIILMGATSEYKLLPTVKSRVKRLEISPFGENVLYKEYKDEYSDDKCLRLSVGMSGGLESEVERIYSDQSSLDNYNFVIDVLLNLKSSRDVIKYTSKITKNNSDKFIHILQAVLRDVLALNSGGECIILSDKERNAFVAREDEFRSGALIGIIDRLKKAELALNFNGNVNMIADDILFGILEEKHKWQKL